MYLDFAPHLSVIAALTAALVSASYMSPPEQQAKKPNNKRHLGKLFSFLRILLVPETRGLRPLLV